MVFIATSSGNELISTAMYIKPFFEMEQKLLERFIEAELIKEAWRKGFLTKEKHLDCVKSLSLCPSYN